jgi:hypothetical protein
VAHKAHCMARPTIAAVRLLLEAASAGLRLVVVFGVVCLIAALPAGCGRAEAPSGTAPVTGDRQSTDPPTSTTALRPTSVTSDSHLSAVDTVFAKLAGEVRPLVVFAPSVLPEGAQMTEAWAPVIDSPDVAQYAGSERGNPWVVGQGADAEVQVVFRVGDGWLVVIENFHGDLGDAAGSDAGTVAGQPAALFSVNGGKLVQWSRNGCWYGVFGRDVLLDDLLAVAAGMRPVSPETS